MLKNIVIFLTSHKSGVDSTYSRRPQSSSTRSRNYAPVKWWWCGRCVCSKTFTSLPDSSIFGTITEKKTKWLSLRSVLALRLLVTPSVLHTTLITQWPIEPRPNNYRTFSTYQHGSTCRHASPGPMSNRRHRALLELFNSYARETSNSNDLFRLLVEVNRLALCFLLCSAKPLRCKLHQHYQTTCGEPIVKVRA